ncbi:glycosyltransferase family 2 protein [uncultured Vibrio sp.]|uniref:glycosyltransferase family 2 protein n=1 Tax=uncultured Vibrio sp. TaxID=114054 RepID=UPI002639C20D|nr:glycosyltransferase family 2 protein [uncultured Vibrio sp.]
MSIYIAVVSHGHSNLINELGCLDKLVRDFNIIVKSNLVNDDFHQLAQERNFHWINNRSLYGCGFGENNNIIFDYCKKELNMKDGDYFVVLNPDVVIDSDTIINLVKAMSRGNINLSSINLYKDFDNLIYDNSIRRFPSLNQFVKSFLGFGNSSIIDRDQLSKTTQVDWAAGSFLTFKVGHYSKLSGFDERYFMYCEDIDICYRSYLMGDKLTYFPEFKACHLAKHANRKLLSMHFYWHVKSAMRFLLTKAGMTKPKSSLI